MNDPIQDSVPHAVVTAKADGTVVVEKFGYKGGACQQAHTWTSELGTVVSSTKKPSFFERAIGVVTQKTLKQGQG